MEDIGTGSPVRGDHMDAGDDQTGMRDHMDAGDAWRNLCKLKFYMNMVGYHKSVVLMR
jgi:hypothetical protein